MLCGRSPVLRRLSRPALCRVCRDRSTYLARGSRLRREAALQRRDTHLPAPAAKRALGRIRILRTVQEDSRGVVVRKTRTLAGAPVKPGHDMVGVGAIGHHRPIA